ncbi:nitrogen regulation protein NR(II) [Methyloversatilis sp.]|uniref:nitrogen regulation protein NR(II) n=1 Tax=Methyloversatilis sp. TaxID=2569862 RepID=UPI0027352F97|nr:nitrogen regulation protein NR(II) [Methyloversatilis sp.]MDP2870536.1 nitrogen regulation protein NR(II) [Methyloversatilis sp.]MDP3287474.1 nitrogen regulation protein NR(II) [Methyloversatilis sp.]MDP3455425.1 nitrogen regulation protein NR(II) [Methyloversatilis sp.]MDP3578078.1 nitrogen regulation protein NR(II) [Methyloversatilis sp.]
MTASKPGRSSRHPSREWSERFSGLELLASAVALLDAERHIVYLNPAAENLFAASLAKLHGKHCDRLIGPMHGLDTALDNALANNWSYTGHNLSVDRQIGGSLQLDCTVSPVHTDNARVLLEFRPIDQQLRIAREEQVLQQQQANRELIRNLAHEIKNPLGGIRGAAQLLERELDRPELREYTQVIINESDRLQDLMNRLLHSHRAMQVTTVSIHEVLERVRLLIASEFPDVEVERDYDTSLPDLTADREQLIQVVLNIARNAAQALKGHGSIRLRTRAHRQATLVKRRHKLALELQVIDNGPGIPEDLLDRIFYPLVSGRDDGTGLGLTLAQSFVHQHHGTIEVQSRPGYTVFTILLPFKQGTSEKP